MDLNGYMYYQSPMGKKNASKPHNTKADNVLYIDTFDNQNYV